MRCYNRNPAGLYWKAGTSMHGSSLPTLQRPVRSRAFTLVELMVVVSIVGVLAAIGITLFRKHVNSARSVEAVNMIQAIRAAQERWRAETQRYLRVSSELTDYYPQAAPGQERVPFDPAIPPNSGHKDAARWARFNVEAPGQVQGVYSTVAGGAGTSPNAEALSEYSGAPDFGTLNQTWYLISAKVDMDGDSEASRYLAASLNGEVYVENGGE